MSIRFLSPTSTRLALWRFAKIGTRLTTTLGVGEWHVVARAEFALLLLNKRIVEVHIVFDGRYVLMPEQLLQRIDVTAEHEITYSEGMTENVRADTLVFWQTGAITNAMKEHIDAATSQSKTTLAQKHMILVGIAEVYQFIAFGAVAINVEQQGAKRVSPKRNTPFLVNLAVNDD